MFLFLLCAAILSVSFAELRRIVDLSGIFIEAGFSSAAVTGVVKMVSVTGMAAALKASMAAITFFYT